MSERATRGTVVADSQRVAIVGVGAIGAVVAELVVRGGGRHVLLFDHDVLSAGNIIRHTLLANDVGQMKAQAVARRLRAANPNARVESFDKEISSAAFTRLSGCSTIIDCTGDDCSLHMLGELVFKEPKRFASVSISNRAKRLFVFVADATRFPTERFSAAIEPWLEHVNVEEMPWDGVGCWSPTFSASVADINLLGSVATKVIFQQPCNGLIVFEQVLDPDGFHGVQRRQGASSDKQVLT